MLKAFKVFKDAPGGVRSSGAGFTLVELLVVVVILVVLAAIAVPLFLNQRDKAVEAATDANVKTFGDAVNAALVDVSDPVSVSYSDGVFTITDAGGGSSTVLGSVSDAEEVIVNPNTYSITVLNGDYGCSIPTSLTLQILPGSGAETICGRVVSKTGNLLPYNMATLENGTTLFAAPWLVNNGVTVYDSTHASSGTGSNKITQNSGNYSVYTQPYNSPPPPLLFSNDPNTKYTTSVSVKTEEPYPTASVSEWRIFAECDFYNDTTGVYGGNRVGIGTPVVTSNTGWETQTRTRLVYRNTPSLGELNSVSGLSVGRITNVNPNTPSTIWVDNLGVWEGEGGVWAPPGQPILQP